MSLITELSAEAASAAKQLALLSTEKKNTVLLDMAVSLRQEQAAILLANEADLSRARDNQLPNAMIDRLTLTPERIESMAQGIETIAELEDPVGRLREFGTRPNGIQINKMRVPLGVICMIYEARPNVTADAGALCFKSGNGVILRGGREALGSSQAIASVMHDVLIRHGLPAALISIVPDSDRALLMELMQQKGLIDLIIPRGGEGLINFVTENSTVPVIQHFKGVCHLYIDKAADLEIALSLAINGKTQRTGVCNALEAIIVHEAIATQFMPMLASAFEKQKVKVNAGASAAKYFKQAVVINDDEFGQEYLSLEVAIRIVPDFAGAIAHIAQFGSNHTEVICTEDNTAAVLFQRSVDASVVMVNASSRFSDGAELGLGAEIGIATTKLHAYGPMGLESLTTEKFLVTGTGQIRE
ncbi:glutamate-5-semialdehyde dehydrogenase [Pseudoalteromonas sp. MMG005]|uniref:glutamate-5-semialdehyde dehydrogenase n=1 Tax=Pseudoalteromonas sp. MMG005 TaxID=2822682 RepID=UPI001B3A3CE8|nr:glutamate-5-semialdehyde dehydrogenase [Pseudoalteromonas sp. MMG005]MBQ4844120.1 glutamate-5-semialdehyde dehydrogenase [Pseudoalteromonas sp. MMG005]